MVRRAIFLSVLLSAVLCANAWADALVLRGGKKIETAGPWVTRGNIVTIHEITGRAQTLILSIIDFDATLKANQHNPPSTADQMHIDTAAVLSLQTDFINQKELSQRIREQAQSDLLAQMTGSKPTKITNTRTGAAQPFGKASAPGKNFQATERCAIWQDNLALYNNCLAANGH
jgi:hypothetical protein